MAPDDEDRGEAADGPEDDGGDLRRDRDAPAADEWAASGMEDLLAQLGAATEALHDVADEAAEVVIEGSSAGGSVIVQLTGSLEAVSVRIDPQLVDAAEVAMLEDAVLAALRDALAQAVEFREELEEELEDTGVDLSSLIGRLGGQLGALGLPDLGGATSPQDLIAGLTGALGSLPGGFGGSVGGALPNLSDLMAGLGLSGASHGPGETSHSEGSPHPAAGGDEEEAPGDKPEDAP